MSIDQPKIEPCEEPSERSVFARALGLRGEERAAYLSEVCAGRAEVRERVEELLREATSVGGDFLETPAAIARPGDTALITAPSEQPGDRIDRFKLLQKIGEGGCGVVYLAEQEVPVRRRVALKVIKLGMDTKAVIARFEAERQALAMMEHPNIAKVFEAGATATGRPYFVMELVRGVSITDYCDENRLPARHRLQLFILVCQAIQHAHQKGVIHRDIKPSNILVTLHDGVPVPKVIDFGIAKATEQRLTEKTLFTEFHAFIGTPAYTSPEQAEMNNLDVDTRSDLYSLGVLLYELLVGGTPFAAERLVHSSLHEMRRIIMEEEPPSPSARLSAMDLAEETRISERRRMKLPALKEAVRGDLDWVVMKCLEKDRTRRYASANDLALDVQRYLDTEPVLARPPSNVYRMRKLLRKHRAAFVAVAGVAAALVLGAGVSLWQAVRATQAQQDAVAARQQESLLREEAEEERERAQRGESSARLSEYVADINLARHSLRDGNLGRAIALLNKHEPTGDDPDLRGFEWRYLRELCRGDDHVSLPTQAGPVTGVMFSPGGDYLAVNAGGRLNIYELGGRTLVTTLSKGAASMAFLPDGKSLVTVNVRTLRLWDTKDWTERRSFSGYAGPLALSGDGRFVASLKHLSRRSKGVVVWETGGWTEIAELKEASAPLSFSGDGKQVAMRTDEGIGVWQTGEMESGVETMSELIMEDSTNVFGDGVFGFLFGKSMEISPDGKYLVVARNALSDRGVFVLGIWAMDTGRELGTMPSDSEHIEHTAPISRIAFSPDTKLLATASEDYSVRLWDMEKRERLAILQGHADEAWAVTFSADGKTIASGDKAGGVKLWPAKFRPKQDILAGTWQPIAFSSDASTLAVLSRDRSVVFLDVETREPKAEFELGERGRRFGPQPVGLSADLRLLAYGTRDGVVEILNTQTGVTNSLETGERRLDFLALSPDGRLLATGARGRALRLWDRLTGEGTVLDAEAHLVKFSHDGKTLASVHWDQSVLLWDVSSRQLRTNVVVESGARFGLAFSHDDSLLAIACRDDAIRLLDTRTGELVGTCTGHKQGVFSVAFSQDDKTLATSSDDSTLKLWNTATQQELLSDRLHGGGVTEVLFSPDGQLLVRGSTVFSQTTGLRFYHAPQRFKGLDSAAVVDRSRMSAAVKSQRSQ